ncbi:MULTISPECIES: TRAP transporter small permease [Paenibacillus]|uniref:TRAP transporter small permease n=1 Tax=Paenibacillus TaxID=44249 RepID=UPI00088C9191|nr:MULTISPECIES: TRAP transporter small permease [Paenibacillus]SDJ69228.1 TRAP-type C4-dicarboxylate transport system, small permease component [Paenibacillus naphthalenovorans]
MKNVGKAVENLFNGFIALALSLMAILVFGNVVLRYLFNSGITWSEEMARFLFIWLVLLGAVIAFKENSHLGVDMLVKRLSKPLKKIVFIISNVILLAVIYLVVEGSWKITLLNAGSTAPATGLPLTLIYGTGIIMGIGMGLIIIFKLYRVLFANEDVNKYMQIHESEEIITHVNTSGNKEVPR